jgi:hypothetical protein
MIQWISGGRQGGFTANVQGCISGAVEQTVLHGHGERAKRGNHSQTDISCVTLTHPNWASRNGSERAVDCKRVQTTARDWTNGGG